MRVFTAVLFCTAAFWCLTGCAMHEYAERKYSNPQFYPYPYLYYSPYPVPYTYDPLADWRKPTEEKRLEQFEGEAK